jgi:hypothetical protein
LRIETFQHNNLISIFFKNEKKNILLKTENLINLTKKRGKNQF